MNTRTSTAQLALILLSSVWAFSLRLDSFPIKCKSNIKRTSENIPYSTRNNLTYVMKENTSLTPLPTFPLPAFYLISPSGSFLHYKKKEKKKLPFTPQVRHLFPMLQPAVTPFLVCKISMSILLFCMVFFSYYCNHYFTHILHFSYISNETQHPLTPKNAKQKQRKIWVLDSSPPLLPITKLSPLAVAQEAPISGESQQNPDPQILLSFRL